ncbi:MAG: 30S ribosomal protein S9 [Desulfarculales bacterium]|jgi:small subunit ribosomal protein S9|nr:30S ribosomal protein S9 [Desulfarculales bacterium]
MAETRYYATGRRKTAVARCWLVAGSGKVTVNTRPVEQFFGRQTDSMILRNPLVLTETADKFDVIASVRGGGASGQAGAIRHGIARALLNFNPDLRQLLKRSGFLTRDSRKKERKKYGQRGARARFQYSKR